MPLHLRRSPPLEREFEGWVVREIEDYFLSVGHGAEVWAVSPSDESTWPSDEYVHAFGKLIGIQFKKANLIAPITQSNRDYSRLAWRLNSPAHQLPLIQRHPEIFYGLPTFLNREWKLGSLHHCLFWRPPAGAIADRAWYDNHHASILPGYGRLGRDPAALRWGSLVERVLRCEVGAVIQRGMQMSDYFGRLRPEHRPLTDPPNDGPTNDDVMYFIHIPIQQ